MKACRITLSLISAAALWAQAPQSQAPAAAPHGGRFAPSPDGFGPGGPNLERHLTKALNLTAEQQNKVHTAIEESRVQSKGMIQQAQTLHQSLAAAVKSGDEGQIDKAAQDMAALHQQQTAIHAKAMAKIYAALSPDQKAQVGKNLEMLMGPGGRGPGMRPARNPSQTKPAAPQQQ